MREGVGQCPYPCLLALHFLQRVATPIQGEEPKLATLQ